MNVKQTSSIRIAFQQYKNSLESNYTYTFGITNNWKSAILIQYNSTEKLWKKS